MFDLMRLREIFSIARGHFNALRGLKASTIRLPTNVEGVAISGVPELRAAVEVMVTLPLGAQLQLQFQRILEHPMVMQSGSPVHATNEQWTSLQQLIEPAQVALQGVLAALSGILGKVAEDQFSVRLPPLEGGGLDAMRKVIDDLHRAIEEPVRRVLGGDVRVVGFDRGSAWIEIISTTGPAVVGFVHLLVSKWQDYLKRKAEIQALEAKARELEAGATVLENIAQAQEIMLSKWLEREALVVVAEFIPDETSEVRRNGESLSVVKESIRTGAKLLQRGAAVDLRRLQPGVADALPGKLEAPPEVRLLGPGDEDSDELKRRD